MDSQQQPDTASDLLDLAVAQSMINRQQADELLRASLETDTSPPLLAVKQGLLDPVQIDILRSLLDATDVAPGFEVIDVLGRGGLGVVFRARQTQLNRTVALKTIPLSRMNHSSVASRFQQEAFAVGRLHHPNIVAAHDFGTHGERIYLAMELVDGDDLESRIRRGGPMNETVAWALARQVAAGLAHAAELGIVHRDIKPANLLLTKAPAGSAMSPGVPLVKITDFGLAQLALEREDETRLTAAGTAMGTPIYMAPEQVSDAHVDHRADIYALGATVFHMLAGKPPYLGMSTSQIVVAKVAGAMKWLNDLPEDVSSQSRELLRAMVAKEADGRIKNYDALIREIDRLPVSDHPTISDSSHPTPSEHEVETLSQISLPNVQKKATFPWKRYAVAGVLALSLGGVGFYVYSAGGLSTNDEFAASNWQRPLFDGESLNGWSRQRGSWQVGPDEEGGTILIGDGSAVRRFPQPKTPEPRLLEDYRVRFGVDLFEAASVEVHFDRGEGGDDSPRGVLRLTRDQVVLGEKAGIQGELQAGFKSLAVVAHSSVDSATDHAIYHELVIERRGTRWWAYFDQMEVGSLATNKVLSTPDLQLLVDGGDAHFADFSVTELVPVNSP